MAVFILEDALSVWTNLGKHSLFVGLHVSGLKTGTRRIIRLDELSSVLRLERRTKEGSSSTRIMRLVPVFIVETYNPTNNECLPKFVQTDNASSNIKTANATQITPDRQLLAAAGRTFCCILKQLRVALPVLPSEPRMHFFKFRTNQKIEVLQDQNGRVLKRIILLSRLFRLCCFICIIFVIIIYYYYY